MTDMVDITDMKGMAGMHKEPEPPVLWSFRRCPYAMRARLALQVANESRIRDSQQDANCDLLIKSIHKAEQHELWD